MALYLSDLASLSNIRLTPNLPNIHRPSYEVTVDIPKGGRIFAEDPIVRLPKDTCSSRRQIFNRVRALPEANFRALQELCSMLAGVDVDRAYADHADAWHRLNNTDQIILACRQSYLRDESICEIACCIQVGWNPNCVGSWNANIGKFTVHALRDIPRGTTLSMSHQNVDCCDVYTQLEMIDRHMGSGCDCPQCTSPDFHTPFWETKKLAVDIERLLREAQAFGEKRSWTDCLTLVEKLVNLQQGFGCSKELCYA